MTELLTVFTIPDAIERTFAYRGMDAANYELKPYLYQNENKQTKSK
jgi:hypothetical protein